MKATGTVRLAEAADLPLIQDWLKQEQRNGFGFINNWNMIQNACGEQKIIVFATDEGPVASSPMAYRSAPSSRQKVPASVRGSGEL